MTDLPLIKTTMLGRPFWRELASTRKLLRYPLGNRSIRIAILDGPVDLSHSVFNSAEIKKTEGPARAYIKDNPASTHGTHVASIIFGHPDSPVPGIAPRCSGVVIPIFEGDDHLGVKPCSQEEMASAIRVALREQAHIINISAGQYDPEAIPEPALAEALAECASRNVIVVAAAGNDGCACPHVPAATPTVLVVGAMDDEGNPLSASNWGSAYADHGLIAPGAGIPGALPHGGITSASGTSFATAIVSGIIGLVLSERLADGRPLSRRTLMENLLDATDSCPDPKEVGCERVMAGRLNIERLLMKEKSMKEQKPNSEGNSIENENASPMVDPPVAPARAYKLKEQVLPQQDEAIYQSGQTVVPASGAGPLVCSECSGQVESSSPTASSPTSKVSKPTFVYGLGVIGYDFLNTTRRESFIQSGLKNPDDPASLLGFLEEHPYAAEDLFWTLKLGSSPIYVLRPYGAFGIEFYSRMRSFLKAYTEGKADRLSAPGGLGGQVTLSNGQQVSVLYPDLRGLFSWNVEDLTSQVKEELSGEEELPEAWEQDLRNLLDRLYYELRNTGLSGADRAQNYAATNAFMFHKTLVDCVKQHMTLDKILVEPSPYCPPESECFDVILEFFNPKKRIEEARLVYRYTINVADVMPVLTEEPRHWHIY